jgi:hypothetical protein
MMIRPTGEETTLTRKQLLAFRAAEEETLRARWAGRRKRDMIQSGTNQRSLPDGQGPGRDTQCPSGVDTETTNKEEVTGNE